MKNLEHEAQKLKYGEVIKVLAQILVLNIIVSLAKIVYGFISNTASMIADGFHSFSDGASNVVGIVGIWISGKPADETHPYGHHKVETLSTIAISFLLFFVAIKIAIDAYGRIASPTEPDIGFLNFAVMIVTTFINIFVVVYEKAKGHKLKSSILISDSKHTQSDIYISISVVLGFIFIKMGFPIADPIISFVISLLIVKAGLEILRDAIDVLIDAQMMDTDDIHEIVMEFEEVCYCHKIRTRGKENHIMIDLHVGVDRHKTIEEAHDIAHRIENRIIERREGVYEVIVHVEPGCDEEV